MKKILLVIVAIAPFLWNCDEIDNPIPEGLGQSIKGDSVEYIVDADLSLSDSTAIANFIKNTTWVKHEAPDNSSERFIVLEEFTGHTCIFCPAGTREILRLDSIYKEQLIPVGIHAGGFAVPRSSGTKYRTDFRVEGGHGETYLQAFNPGNAYPRGMVSRLGATSVSSNQWSQDIASIKDDAPSAKLGLTTYLGPDTNIIRANIRIEWLQTLPDNYKLQVYLVEDHITDWQKDGAQEIPDYDHRHVLRKVVNDTWGKSLQSAVSGEKELIEYIFPYKKNEWKASDMEVVVFIFNDDPNSYEVIQANASYLVP
jgi:hypothetical protein